MSVRARIARRPARASPATSLRRRVILVAGVLLLVAFAVAWARADRILARYPWLSPGPLADRSLYLGFDVRDYPGAAVMKRLRARSPYRFVGYYLASPNHPGTSWMGTWASSLRPMGWGVVVIYVGRQTRDLSAAQGAADARDALAEAEAEDLPAGAAIYLDIEATDEVGPDLVAYARGWVREAWRSDRFHPGVYCHVKNAIDLRAALEGIRDAEIPFWVAGDAARSFSTKSDPVRSGIRFADLWQGQLDVVDPSGTVDLVIDVSTATARGPSF